MTATQTPARTTWVVWTVILLSHAIILGAALTRILEVYPRGGPRWLTAFFAVWAVVMGLMAHTRWRKAITASLPQEAYINYVIAWSVDQGVSIMGLGLTIFGTPIPIWIWFPVAGIVLAIIHRPRPRPAA